MKATCAALVCTVVLLALSVPVSAADGLGKMKLSKKETSLLRGRLTMRLPRKAKAEPRRRSIMGAEESPDAETRIVITSGADKMVVMAYEMFALAGSDFDKKVRDLVGDGEGNYSVERLELGNPSLYAVATIPAKLDPAEDASLVAGVYLANSDNTVQFLGFYVNSAAAQDREGALRLARSMMETVRPGPSSLEIDGGPRVLSGGVKVEVPKGYVITAQRGPDFWVHSIRKLVPLGQSAPSLGVYIGGHPAYHHEREGVAHFELLKLNAFGAERTWHRWAVSKSENSQTMLEVMVSNGMGLRGHVFLLANGPAHLEELKTIAATLEWAQ